MGVEPALSHDRLEAEADRNVNPTPMGFRGASASCLFDSLAVSNHFKGTEHVHGGSPRGMSLARGLADGGAAAVERCQRSRADRPTRVGCGAVSREMR